MTSTSGRLLYRSVDRAGKVTKIFLSQHFYSAANTVFLINPNLYPLGAYEHVIKTGDICGRQLISAVSGG
jgi:hypothetical protein